MKNAIRLLYFAIFLFFCTGLSQAEEQKRNDRPEPNSRPNVFATVNGTPLDVNLYQFLLGSRQQDMDQRQAYDDDFDAEVYRQQTANDLVMTELLAQQAARLGLDETESVRVELAMAKKTLLAQLYVKQLMDSIDIEEAQLQNYYDQHSEQTLYRFLIWQAPSEEEATDLLTTLTAGKGSEVSVPEAIETPWLRDTDISPAVKGLVRGLDVEDFVEAPVLQDGVWKVVQVIDKQVMVKRSFEEEKELIKAELVRLRLDEKLEELAEGASIVFHDQQVTRVMK